jgi:hypothetical protein
MTEKPPNRDTNLSWFDYLTIVFILLIGAAGLVWIVKEAIPINSLFTPRGESVQASFEGEAVEDKTYTYFLHGKEQKYQGQTRKRARCIARLSKPSENPIMQMMLGIASIVTYQAVDSPK